METPPPPPAQPAHPPTTEVPRKSRGCLWVGLVLVLLVGVGLLGLVVGATASSGGTGSQRVVREQIEGAFSFGARKYLALVEIEGVIMDSEPTRQVLEEAREDEDCRGLLLRVNSPGGGVTASDEIWSAIRDFQKTGKPVVVSMGSLAASGGYYVSAPADWIIASPTSLTGSIGVIIQSPAYGDALGRIGVEVRTFTSGENKAMLSPVEEMTPEQATLVQELVDSSYERFVGIVAKGRGLDEQALREGVADGRILAAEQALAAGLVDELAYPDDALAKARSLAGLGAEAPVIKLSPFRSLAEQLFSTSARAPEVKVELAPDVLDNLQPGMPYYLAPQGLGDDS